MARLQPTLIINDLQGTGTKKGKATDNIYIERFFRTIKCDYIYLNAVESGWELYRGIKDFIEGYHKRKHQGTNQKTINLSSFEIKYQLKSAKDWGVV